MTNANEKSSPMVDMANKTAESSCIQTGNLVTAEGTSVQLEIDRRRPLQATVRNVPKHYDMFGTTRELSEVKLHRMNAHQNHLEGRTGEVVQDDGKGKLIVNLHPDRIGGDPVTVRVPLSKLVCKPGGREFLGKLLLESALASSAVTVDEKDAAVYPFGRYDVGEAAETPPPDSCAGETEGGAARHGITNP